MTSKAQSNEAYLEEYNKLDMELKQLQHELADTSGLNDELTKVIMQKEDELYTKDKRLDSLKERNLADGDQLDLELTTLTDKYSFEIAAKEEIVRKLEIQYRRFLEIQRENAGLKESVQMLQALMEKNRDEHAIKMHEKNLEMKQLREDMEKKMREQLNKMDISYQKDAFAALSERHKKAMFQNAKLKDEVALQGVGLNNLGSRLGKQNQQHDLCMKELKSLNKKLRTLKERLSVIAGKKIEITRKKEDVLADELMLSRTKEDLRSRLEADPQLPECIQQREQLHIEILNTKCDIQMWSHRLHQLQDLHVNLKPVYEHELQGRFNPQTFPLEASLSLHSSVCKLSSKVSSGMSAGSGGSRSPSPPNRTPTCRTPATPTRSKGTAGSPLSSYASGQLPHNPQTVPMALRPADLEELIAQDPTLAVALEPLRGKESAILATLPDEAAQKRAKAAVGLPPKPDAFKNSLNERDQNMTAWVTLKIVDIWEETRLENERIKSEKNALLDQILATMHTDGMMASFDDHSHLHEQSTGSVKGLHSQSNSVAPFTQLGGTNTPGTALGAIQELGSRDENEAGQRSVGVGDLAGDLTADASAEMYSLLSAGAEQLVALPAVRTSGALPTRLKNIPALTIEPPEQVAASPGLRGTLSAMNLSRQEERDWIENAELDEEMIHELWDEAFSSVQSESMFGSAHPHGHAHGHGHGHGHGEQHNGNPLTAWLTPVPEAKRYPTTLSHLEHTSPKPMPKAHRRKQTNKGDSSPKAGDYTTEANLNAPSVPRTLTAALLCEPVKYIDGSAKFYVAPPVSVDRAPERREGTAEENKRTLTLPAISSARNTSTSINKGTAHDFTEVLGADQNTSGLQVTEDGLVLKDPLMTKKFNQQRKALVANATKASAALKRSASAGEGVQKSSSTNVLSQSAEQSHGTTGSAMPKKNNKHSLSSSAVGLRSKI